MGQSQSDETPEPGDLIKILRGGYQHWAVYVGDGDIVHVTLPPGADVQRAASNTLMSVPTEKAMVRREKLKEVVGNNKWRINNSLDKKYKPRSPDIIVEEALRQVGEMMEYSVTSKNCEHFATNLRYGQAESRQVLNTVAAHSVIAAKFFRG
ncbi:phospholipase A and acyltransferase 4-like [Acanthopagrus latus]|uniref:phospholipase A and acyltransferase 4-like n=1 Tax=Acanthopagrus latus TaxID=8177 RepID=UPI00187CD5E7|nr:phospholipase A and acyltransferase 4-like [Acanthopagrus latus]XP_036933083.1 phospholipase A and acyltransferase 4-like [Acanthopagrus latus]XP_036933084.1 phospholipase A and acyltransferase 4-like [Acanthopagrus latus]